MADRLSSCGGSGCGCSGDSAVGGARMSSWESVIILAVKEQFVILKFFFLVAFRGMIQHKNTELMEL